MIESLAGRAAAAAGTLTRAGWPPDDARRDAALLARWVLGWSAADWIGRAREPAPPAFASAFEPLLARRLRHEPMAYITGEREFYGRSFQVDRRVLIPRPETELIVEEAVSRLRAPVGGERAAREPRALRIADVGTGSGCLAVTLALEVPGARIVATDVSADALAVARANAARWKTEDRIAWRRGSLLAGAPRPFDLDRLEPAVRAVGRSRGLPPEVANHEPAGALFGGMDGLDVVRALLPEAARALAPGGWLLVEIGAGQAEAAAGIVRTVPALRSVVTRADLQGVPRVVVLQRQGGCL